MTLATKTINGNHSGPLGRPKVVIIHSTRSGRSDFTDAQELAATLSWFQNPNGASSHFVLSELERVRCVEDNRVAWHASYLNGDAWGVEMTQPTPDRPFTEGHYANAQIIGRHYVSLGVAPVWLSFWTGDPNVSGFVDHADTSQGRESGKSDAGRLFDRARFIDSLEDKMLDRDADKETFRQMFREMVAVDKALGPLTTDDRRFEEEWSKAALNSGVQAAIGGAVQSHGSSPHGGGGTVTIPAATISIPEQVIEVK